MNEQRWVDKTTWGEGPWQDEPDKVNWTDAGTALPCMIHRGPSGALCGYVGVPPGHPLHGVSYTDFDGEGPYAHGGITFTEACQPHDGPGGGICHTPEPGEADDVWWIGFDCAHGQDVMPAIESAMRQFSEMGAIPGWPATTYKDIVYVTNQCKDLAMQLTEMGHE